MIPQINIIQDDRIFDHTVIPHKYLLKQHGIFNRTVDDAPAPDQAVLHRRARVVLCRRQVAHLGIHRWKLPEEIFSDLRSQEIHIRLIIRVYPGNIIPIAAQLISVDLFQILITDQDIRHKIIMLFLCAVLHQINQKPSAHHVDACGNGLRAGHHRLLFKFLDPVRFVHPHGAETGRVVAVLQILHHHRNVRLLRNMVFQYLIVIQLIHRIAGSDDHIRLMTPPQEVQVLVNGIRRPPVPVAILRRNGRCKNIQAALLSSKIPPLGRIQMLVQRPCIILCQHRDSLNVGVRHVAQRKINGPVAGCDRHRRNRALRRQCLHPSVVASRENNPYCSHTRSPAFINVSPLSSTPFR